MQGPSWGRKDTLYREVSEVTFSHVLVCCFSDWWRRGSRRYSTSDIRTVNSGMLDTTLVFMLWFLTDMHFNWYRKFDQAIHYFQSALRLSPRNVRWMQTIMRVDIEMQGSVLTCITTGIKSSCTWLHLSYERMSRASHRNLPCGNVIISPFQHFFVLTFAHASGPCMLFWRYSGRVHDHCCVRGIALWRACFISWIGKAATKKCSNDKWSDPS